MNNEKYFEFLDELRESGKTNMYGAGPYLRDEFPELDKAQTGKIILEWMETFGERHPKDVV